MQKRSRYLSCLAMIYVALCFLQRLIYTGWIVRDGAPFPEGFAVALLKGFVFDLATCGFLFLPLALVLSLLPARWRDSRSGRALTIFFSLLPLLVGILSICFEFFFWEEFHARYNFIAVDYLVYTHEVIRNIWESYPVVWFFVGFAIVIGAIARKMRGTVKNVSSAFSSTLERALIFGTTIALVILNVALNEDGWLENDPFWGRELGKNSLYALFSAYNRNSIDYKQFYLSLDEKESRAIALNWLGKEEGDLSREIRGRFPEKKWNVMMVAIESMSARFLTHFGSDKPLTPNLDRMADEGLFFTKLYATGSRTVRGLEALMLSLPPTPGQSILRRPKSDHLFNFGTMFRERGYETQFVYGGYARFDNMGPWFASNGFDIVDKGEFAPGGVTFSTAWGACDEDLFAESIRRADAAAGKGKNFFQVILTTSNHRPYDFPDGRIDIKSHTGRDGAIKYTDFAIGKFVEDARKKPWFKNTLFVFMADHNASVAGGTDVPIRDYLIPVIVYNPELVKPQKVDKLASQIDVAPTLLGLLGFSYKSWFFGQDLMSSPGGRALIGTYQKVALLEPGKLAILDPGRKAQLQELGPEGQVKSTEHFSGAAIPDMVKRAVAIYQSASELFTREYSKVEKP